MKIAQRSNYPWDGEIRLEIQNEKAVEATIYFRIPGWAQNEAVPSDLFVFKDEQDKKPSMEVNGQAVQMDMEKGYVAVHRRWQKGDVISLNLPMEDRMVEANRMVEAKAGLVAVQYGPIVYCAEEIDNRVDVLDAKVSESSRFNARFLPDLLGGVNILEGEELNLVPYYAWANRGAGKMNVWFDQ